VRHTTVKITIRGVAQPGSASALGAEGRVFESLRPDHNDMKYIIYKNKKSPTQSGKLNKDYWILEHINSKGVKTDLLTGWKTTETNLIKKMKFFTKEEAILYAENNGLDFELSKEVNREMNNKSYADNFKFKRVRTDI
tara:strand:+ start:79 stop:492 length:414 start_codon:yes stop_codon:yes gene_type:complete